MNNCPIKRPVAIGTYYKLEQKHHEWQLLKEEVIRELQYDEIDGTRYSSVVNVVVKRIFYCKFCLEIKEI